MGATWSPSPGLSSCCAMRDPLECPQAQRGPQNLGQLPHHCYGVHNQDSRTLRWAYGGTLEDFVLVVGR